MKCVHAVVLTCVVPAAVSADDDASYEQQLAARRSAYVQWIADTFGQLEPAMDPRDGRRWALSHARLVLNRDLDKANRYFESFGPLPGDADIYFIRFLRTLLDFHVCLSVRMLGPDQGLHPHRQSVNRDPEDVFVLPD